MPSRLPPRGHDDLEVAAYFAHEGEDSPELRQWQQDHPDWFVAGDWTADSGAPSMPWNRFGGRTRRRMHPPTPIGDPIRLSDPATLSVAGFLRIGAEARAARSDPSSEIGTAPRDALRVDERPTDAVGIPIQFVPRSPANRAMPGSGFQPRTMEEEVRLFNFNSALGELRRLEPNNRELNFMRDAERAPSREWVQMLEREVEMARMRSHRALPEFPTERKGADDDKTAHPTIFDLLAPGGRVLGTSGSRESIREVPGGNAAARALFEQLRRGGRDITPSGYPGTMIQSPNDYVNPTLNLRKLKFLEK